MKCGKKEVVFVSHLPDLMTREDYRDSNQNRVRIRIEVTDEGVEILGDSAHPHLLDALLEALDPETIEKVLCG